MHICWRQDWSPVWKDLYESICRHYTFDDEKCEQQMRLRTGQRKSKKASKTRHAMLPRNRYSLKLPLQMIFKAPACFHAVLSRQAKPQNCVLLLPVVVVPGCRSDKHVPRLAQPNVIATCNTGNSKHVVRDGPFANAI